MGRILFTYFANPWIHPIRVYLNLQEHVGKTFFGSESADDRQIIREYIIEKWTTKTKGVTGGTRGTKQELMEKLLPDVAAITH